MSSIDGWVTGEPARPPASLTTVVNSRLTGRFELDAWGFDPQLVALFSPLAGLRWSVHVDGIDLLPRGPALLVYSRRAGWTEGVVLATQLTEQAHRPVRLVGGIDRAPVNAAASRLGWIPPTTADLRAALRAGRSPAVGLGRSIRHRFSPGSLDPALVQAAIDVTAPVVPVAVVGRELGRRWQVVIGAPVAIHAGTTTTADALAQRARERVGQLLEAAKPHHLPF